MARGQDLDPTLSARINRVVPSIGAGRFASLPLKQEAGFGRTASLNATPVQTPVVNTPATQVVASPSIATPPPVRTVASTSTPVATPAVKSTSTETIVNGDVPRGTGMVTTNGKTTQVGSPIGEENASIGSPPPSQANTYNTYAKALVDQSQALLSKEGGTSMASDGTSISAGANAVGAGFVARGLLNKAKAISDIGNQQDGTQIQQQNADTNQIGVRSQAAERLKESARQDNTNSLDVTNKKLEQAGLQRVNDLQTAYLNETDPVKRDNIASQIGTLTGKTVDKFQPITGKDDVGNTTYLGAFDQRKGDFKPQTSIAAAGISAPPGMKQVGFSGGKPVYEDAQGKRFIQ